MKFIYRNVELPIDPYWAAAMVSQVSVEPKLPFDGLHEEPPDARANRMGGGLGFLHQPSMLSLRA